MSLFDQFVTDLADAHDPKYCGHPDHKGCRKCDEDALGLREREEYEGYDDE
jgi:hypothetical protein